jgi:hypothetical protein
MRVAMQDLVSDHLNDRRWRASRCTEWPSPLSWACEMSCTSSRWSAVSARHPAAEGRVREGGRSQCMRPKLVLMLPPTVHARPACCTLGHRKVYWQNLREEPLVFINGQPFVVREADQPFSNLEYTGIDRTRVEDMEVRLKQDILAEVRSPLSLPLREGQGGCMVQFCSIRGVISMGTCRDACAHALASTLATAALPFPIRRVWRLTARSWWCTRTST